MSSLLGNIISGTVKTLAVLTIGIIGIGTIAIVTKPSDENLHKTISKQAPFGFKTVAQMASANIVDIDDFVVLKLGTFPGEKKPTYIGVFNTWLPLKNIK